MTQLKIAERRKWKIEKQKKCGEKEGKDKWEVQRKVRTINHSG